MIKDVHAFRRARWNRWIEEYQTQCERNGHNFRLKDFYARAGITEAMGQQLRLGRKIRDKKARDIEKALGKHQGAMD